MCARYLWLLNQPIINYCFKVELLDHYEQSHGEITADVSDDEYYSININKQQGLRRTCSLTMIDVEKKYLPNINHGFWFNKKFKLYIGVKDGEDIYWFSQGVFVCSNATANRYQVTINGVDKFGFLDGTLNVHMLSETYKVDAGTTIGELIRSVLMLEMGNGLPIDPIIPLIDYEFESVQTINEIVLDPGQYLGEILTQIASMLGADIYYNTNGRLVVERIFNDDFPFYYIYRGAYWHFSDIHENYIEPSVNYEMDGCNYIMVATDNTEGEVYSYTAENNNPQSPICISVVGYRKDKDTPISYIPMGSTIEQTDAEEKCRQYAEYLLMQKTCPTLAVSFLSPMMPHLNVGEIITITDDYFDYNYTPFLIQSMTFNSIDNMTLSVVNLQWLPSYTQSASITNK